MDLLVDGINYGVEHIIDWFRHLKTSFKIIERNSCPKPNIHDVLNPFSGQMLPFAIQRRWISAGN
jgi:hypothetical protein